MLTIRQSGTDGTETGTETGTGTGTETGTGTGIGKRKTLTILHVDV